MNKPGTEESVGIASLLADILNNPNLSKNDKLALLNIIERQIQEIIKQVQQNS